MEIKFNGDYTKLTQEEYIQYLKWSDPFRNGLDTYTIYHFDIVFIPSNLLKIIVAYAIKYKQNIDINFKDEIFTSLKIEMCSDCLASAYAEYLGYRLD